MGKNKYLSVAREDIILPNRIWPILRWIGSKKRLVCHIINYLPEDINSRSYWEPFLGAASLFLTVQPRKAFLSDANFHLIQCYESIRDNPNLVYNYLALHNKCSSRDYYYSVRIKYNASGFNNSQAARFIYLNRACFN